MLEKIFFGSVSMPAETIRILLAFAGTVAATYFDLFNDRNVPDRLLYAFLIVAFFANLAFYSADLFYFTLGATIAVAAFGYVFYRTGQLGGADVLVIASIMLLLPIHPKISNIPFNFPFIFSTMIFAGGAFAIYVIAFYGLRVMSKNSKPKLAYALMLIPYILFVYVFYTSPFFQPIYFGFVTLLFIATMFFMMYREDLNRMLAEKLPVNSLQEEDVLALEMMDPRKIKKYKLTRIVSLKEIERLKETDIKDLVVFSKMPPFLPFLLLGMILALLFARSLILL